MKAVTPPDWSPAKGYANGITCRPGRMVFVAGQIGWDAQQTFTSDDLVVQTRQALLNVVAVLRAAEAGPEHIVRMTWYLTDKRDYVARLGDVGQAYREVIGRNFPAMTAVEVRALIEDRAVVEIECTAVVEEPLG